MKTNAAYFACLFAVQLILPSEVGAGEEVVARWVVRDGDLVDVYDANGVPTDAVASLVRSWDPQSQWGGSFLGVDLEEGVGLWDGTQFSLVAGDNYPLESFVSLGAFETNRDGNPPEEPVLREGATSGLAVSPAGKVAFFTDFIEDLATSLPEVWPDFVGVAQAGGGIGELEVSQQVFGKSLALPLWGEGGFVFLTSGIGGDADAYGWLFGTGSEVLLWSKGMAAPGTNGLVFTGVYTFLDTLTDRTLLVSLQASPDGTASAAEDFVYLISPDGEMEMLWSGLPQPYETVAGESGSFAVGLSPAGRDLGRTFLNRDGDVVTVGVLYPEGGGFKTTLIRKKRGQAVAFLLVEGMEMQDEQGASLGVVERIRDRRVAANGDIAFEADIEGRSGVNVFRYVAESGTFRSIGLATDEPVPVYESFEVKDVRILNMNTGGRLFLSVSGRESVSQTVNGGFFEAEDGSFAPVYWDKKIRVEGVEESFVTVVGTQVSEGNTVSLTLDQVGARSVVVARIASELEPVGNRYIWDGGAGSNDWHTVVDGRSNWVDTVGTPWPNPPVMGAEVEITSGASVVLANDASVKELELAQENAELVVDGGTLVFETNLRVPELSQLRIKSGVVRSFEGSVALEGTLLKEGGGEGVIDVIELTVGSDPFVVNGGKLQLTNLETVFEDSRIEVNEGELLLKDEATRILGTAGVTFSVEQGVARLESDAIILEGNLRLESSEGGNAVFGRGDLEQEVTFVGGTEEAKRTLTVAGDGVIEIRRGFMVTDTQALLMATSAPFDRANLVVDMAAEDAIVFDVETTLVTRLDLRGGRLTGDLINEGRIVAGTPGTTVALDVVNRGGIEQRGNLQSSFLVNEDGALYSIYSGMLTAAESIGDEEKLLVFEAGSRLFGEGDGGIHFVNTEDEESGLVQPHLVGTEIQVNRGKLALREMQMSGEVRATVVFGATLDLEDIRFHGLEVKGAGVTLLEGDVHCSKEEGQASRFFEDPVFTQSIPLKVKTRKVEIGDIRFLREGNGTHWFVFGRGLSGDDLVTLQSVDLKTGVYLRCEVDAEVKDLIMSKQGFAGFTRELRVSSSVKIDPESEAVDGIEAEVRTPALIAHVDGGGTVLFEAWLGTDELSVEAWERTKLRIGWQRLLLDFATRELIGGKWVVKPGGSVEFYSFNEDYAISGIGQRASVVLAGNEADGSPQFPGLPNRSERLSVRGKLEIDGVTLQMNGNLLDVDGGQLRFENGGKVEGDLRALSSEVEGVLSLASLSGAVNVTGNTEINGVLGVGASPGYGYFGGDLTLQEGSEVVVEFAGKEDSEYDRIEVGGTAHLSGALVLKRLDGFEAIEEGDRFSILDAGAIEGGFLSVDQSRLGRTLRMSIDQSDTSLEAVAELLEIGSYAEWRSVMFSETDRIDEAVSGLVVDWDKDGWTNLEEYLFGGLPGQVEGTDFFLGLVGSEQGGELRFAWAEGINDYDWMIQKSEDLEMWSDVDGIAAEVETLGGVGRYTLSIEDPEDAERKVFYRLKVVEQE